MDLMLISLYTQRAVTTCESDYTLESLVGKTVYYESCDDSGNILKDGVGTVTDINKRLIDIVDSRTRKVETVYTDSETYIWDALVVLW